MSFKQFKFNQHILKSLDQLGYNLPTPIQQQAIKPILEGRDLIGLAQTGTGKTAAFVLPIIQNLCDKPSTKSKVLIISPTRELAEQTHAYIEKFSDHLKISSVVIYGGVSRQMQVNKLRQGANIIVACPGRLLDLANDRALDLSAVEMLVLDEADQMLDKGFLPDIKRILAKLPQNRQNLVFSATMPSEVKSLIDGLLNKPVEVKINHTEMITNISHSFYQVESRSKAMLLKSLLDEESMGTAIVFTRTKHKAKKLALQLTKSGYKATSLQGNLSQSNRQRALDGFKDGTYTLLIATDIASRGIDVAGISHVINFDMPETTEAYTHRTGRTGRAGLTGAAFSFVTADDSRMIKSLKRTLGNKLTFRSHEQSMPEEVIENKEAEIRKSAPKPKIASQRTKGKRSSQRNRSIRFDFGI